MESEFDHEDLSQNTYNSLMRKVGVIVEARMTSTRLPGKHLLECRGIPMITRLIARLKSIDCISEIVIATTVNRTDDPLVETVKRDGVTVFRGSENNVMGRVLHAAVSSSLDVICEITGDCPVVDIKLSKNAINTFLSSEADYLNNSTFGLPDGIGCQVFSTAALENSYRLTNNKLDLEHVTSHIIRSPALFSCVYPETPNSLSWPELSLSLDELTDFEVLSELICSLEDDNPTFGAEDIIKFFKSRPDLVRKSTSVYRRGYE